MTTPDTAQATGPMTFEQGIASLKAKMAEKNVTASNQATELDENGFPLEEAEQAEPLEVQTDDQETAEQVSDDEPQEQETEEPDNRPIILPDGSEITVEEARKGYLRQSDFSKKTELLAREREALVLEKQGAIKELGSLYQQLASLQETEPNWLQLAQDPNVDPKQLQAMQAQWQYRKAAMDQSARAIAQANAEALRLEKAKAYQALNSGEFDPSWKDEAKLKTALNTVSDYWIERGLPADMLDGITNPVVIEVVEESRRYRELQKAKPKATLAVKGKPKPFVPGTKSTETPQSAQLKSLSERYRNNPSLENGIALERYKASMKTVSRRS